MNVEAGTTGATIEWVRMKGVVPELFEVADFVRHPHSLMHMVLSVNCVKGTRRFQLKC